MILAVSKAGHDKGTTYVIIKEEADGYYVADGKTKSLSAPKKKNKKHLQLVKSIPKNEELEKLVEKFEKGQLTSDHELKRILTIYNSRRDEDV